MKRTKLEDYVIANGLQCAIEVDIDCCYCCLYKKNDLYMKFFKGKTLNEAIEKAINTHREKFQDDKRSEQEIQNEKRARMFHKRFSDRK